LAQVESFIKRRRLLVPGDRVLVGVSGGPDSLALLHLLTRLAEAWGLSLHVVHVNHGLRAEAADDAAFVEAVGREWDLPVTVAAVDVGAERRRGESIQQAARRVRYRVFAETAAAFGASRIALGHHADDQAETVLMRFLRGAGAAGLAGMRPRRGRYIRPLLEVTRAGIEAYCQSFGLKPRRDPSNLSRRYLRSRIRYELLPLLAREYNPNIGAVLARTAALLRDDDDLLEALALKAYRRMTAEEGSADVPSAGELPLEELRRLPLALARRVVRRHLAAFGVNLAAVTADHVAAILGLLDAGGAVTLPGGTTVRRRGLWLIVEQAGGTAAGAAALRAARAATTAEAGATTAEAGAAPAGGAADPQPGAAVVRELAVPGRTEVPELGIVMEAEIVEPPVSRELAADPKGIGGPGQAIMDWEHVVPPLVVRTWRPGDRLAPLGLGGTKKVQDIFVDAKVPAHKRASVPIVADGEGIVWVCGLRLAARVSVGDGTQRILRLRTVRVK